MFNIAVSNYKRSNQKPIYATLINKKTNSKFNLQVFISKKKDNNSTNSKSITYLFSTDTPYVQPDSIQTDGGQTKKEWDGSFSVQGYVTLVYSTDNSNGNKVLLTNVNGGWYQEDLTTKISDREVIYACEDPVTYFSQHVEKYPSSNTFNYNTNFSHYVLEDGKGTMCGADISCTLQHGSDSWTFNLNNNLFDNM
ncbi:hypothetical protein [Caproicibacter sp.]|uniref:hypothetical protein n=1 Tax=Caproicibacter sp. TaxID=2814884 RepID=UPI003988FCA9